MKTKDRFFFIDALRAFIIFLVVADHVAIAYALHFGDMWFVKDVNRSVIYDVIHLLIDAFHMPILFLLAGFFTLSSVQRRGVGNFMKERWIRLGIPFVLGVILLCPPQTYGKYLQQGGTLGYWNYLIDVFFKYDWYASPWGNFDYPAFSGDLSSSGFWFLYFLMLLSIIAVLIWRFAPFVIRWIGTISKWLVDHPIPGYIAFSLVSAVLISYMELFWGSKFWIGFWDIFYCRANLLPLFCLFFVFGIGLREAGYLKETAWLNRLANQWIPWTAWTLALCIAYSWYCLAYYVDGAYNLDIVIHFHQGGDWASAWPILGEAGPLIWVRTTLHGFLYTAETITLVAIFYKFFNKGKRFWVIAGAVSYGVFIFHEPLCVWAVYFLAEASTPTWIKYLLVTFGGFTVSWLFVHHVIFKTHLGRRIIGS